MKRNLVLLMTFVYGVTLMLSNISVAADKLELLAGGEEAQVNIPAQRAQLLEPFGAEFDEQGELWIIEMASGNRLLKVNREGVLEHIAGIIGPRKDNKETLVDGPGLKALFYGPHNLAIMGPGEVFISDTWNGRIRVWNQMLNNLSCLPGYSVDKPQARTQGPYCVALNPDKTILYLANLQQVYARDLHSGAMTLVAGNGKKGIPIDGTMAVESPLVDPRAIAADEQGNLYILERNGNALRVVRPSGKIETLVNRTGKKGNGLEEGRAIDIGLNGPKHLCIDIDGGVLIADAESNTIRKYDPQKRTIKRLIGTGKTGKGSLDSSPLECMLARPHGVSVQASTGNIVVTDSYNNRVLLLRRH
jgi:DNA-binding beta-propeller fold protein YncE